MIRLAKLTSTRSPWLYLESLNGESIMRAVAVFRLAKSNERVAVGPGEFIGRSDVATLCVDDPRISEAHAMVSLRDRHLKLMSLRGRFRVEGQVLHEVILAAGMVLELAPGVNLVCESIHMPDALVGVKISGIPEVPLTGTMTLHAHGVPSLKRGFDPAGDAVFWSVGEQWRVRVDGAPTQVLALGDVLECFGLEIEVVNVPLSDLSQPRTKSALRAPLVFVCANSHVRIERASEVPLRVSGIPGKILSSVLCRGGQADWQEIVEDVWPGEQAAHDVMRRRFDAGLRRLRDALLHISQSDAPLLTLDGAGVLVFHLTKQDRVEQPNERLG